MKFTQFKFPDGRRNPEIIDRPDEIEALADELKLAGWSFEIEINPDTQFVHMDCCDANEALTLRVCRNGEQVPVKVDELVRESHALWLERGKPLAAGSRTRKEWTL